MSYTCNVADMAAVVAKLEEFIKLVDGREEKQREFRQESAQVLQQRMLQTQETLAKYLKEVHETIESSISSREPKYATQYREAAESIDRVEAAIGNRSRAIRNLRTAIEERKR